MIDEQDGDDWVSRRDPDVRRPVRELTATTLPTGLAVLAPEVELLYKAKGTRPKDRADFDAVLPHLDDPAKAWLLVGLRRLFADHEWTSRLDALPTAPHDG